MNNNDVEINTYQVEHRLFSLNLHQSLHSQLDYDEILSDVSNQPVYDTEFQNQQCFANLVHDHHHIINDQGMKPLHHMALNYDGDNDIDSIIMFINVMVYYGFPIDELDEYGNSPLHYACTNDYSLQLVYAFLKCGSTMLEPNKDNETPLHCAIKDNQCCATKLLISWFPQFLFDHTLERCVLDQIIFDESCHSELFKYIRQLHRCVVWLYENHYFQYINILVQLEISQPYTIIDSELNGQELIHYAYNYGQQFCDINNVPVNH